MRPGDLARVVCREVIYTTRRGGNCIGAADQGDIVMILEIHEKNNLIKILHPTAGVGFTHRAYAEVIDETR